MFKVIIFVIMLTSSLSAASFEQEKALIDAHVKGDIRAHIQSVVDYTHEALKHDIAPLAHGNVELAFAKFENSKADDFQEEIQYDYGFRVIYGGLTLLSHLPSQENLVESDLFEAMEIATLLLSPALFNKDFAFKRKDYSLYKNVMLGVARLYAVGSYLIDDVDKEKVMPIFWPEKTSMHIYNFAPRYFSHLVLCGDLALFSEQAFLYALSKGISLLGLTSAGNDAHGGLYSMPATLYMHDLAHIAEIIRPYEGTRLNKGAHFSEDQMVKVAQIVTDLAGKLYHLIYETELFAPTEKAKASTVAFDLLHENQIYKSTEALSRLQILSAGPSSFDVLISRLRITLFERLHVVGSLMPPSLGGEVESRESQTDDDPHFYEKVYGDYAKMIVRLFPEHEMVIYGSDKSIDRTYIYHGENVYRLSLALVNWFAEKVKGHIS